jgi:hypothetical protein
MLDLTTILMGLRSLFRSPSYGETLEQYIVSKHPKDSSDIDRLTLEWQRNQSRGLML